MRLDELPGGIRQVPRASIFGGDGNEVSRGRSNADGEYSQALLRRCPGRRDSPSVEILTVRHEDENPVTRGTVFECGLCQPYRCRDIRAAARDRIRIQRLHRIPKGVVVSRDRRLQKSIPRKRDQPDSVAVEMPEQVLRGQLCACEPIRLHVGSQHTFRGVDRDQDIEPLAGRGFDRVPPLGSCQRYAGTHRSGDHQAALQPEPFHRHRARQLPDQACRGECTQQGRAATLLRR